MAQEALLYDPDLVRIVPVSPTRHVRGRENFDLGSELLVGHKVGLITDAETPSDGLRRRDTVERGFLHVQHAVVAQESGDCDGSGQERPV